jgi:hypothetical protein
MSAIVRFCPLLQRTGAGLDGVTIPAADGSGQRWTHADSGGVSRRTRPCHGSASLRADRGGGGWASPDTDEDRGGPPADKPRPLGGARAGRALAPVADPGALRRCLNRAAVRIGALHGQGCTACGTNVAKTQSRWQDRQDSWILLPEQQIVSIPGPEIK